MRHHSRRDHIYAPHRAAHDASIAARADRVRSKPATLYGLLRWAQQQYALEPPTNLHSAALIDAGGTPVMTGETSRYLGFTQDREAQDWRAIACSLDRDGSYATPFRCALERVRDPGERAFLRDLAANIYFPRDICDLHGIPKWAADRIAFSALSGLYDRYAAEPMPRRTVSWVDKSDSQRAAEEAA